MLFFTTLSGFDFYLLASNITVLIGKTHDFAFNTRRISMRFWPETIKSVTLLFSLLMMLTTAVDAADYDTDGIDDSVDICVKFYDPLQEDGDGDGIGDVCDTDLYKIETIAGRGVSGFSGDGADATLAQLHSTYNITVDSVGTVYITDTQNNRIRKIGTDGTISTVAGTGTAGFSGDGANATQAQLNSPLGITVASTGAVYFADTQNHRIRKIATDGTISTVAGTGVSGFSGDGANATQAQLNAPLGITVASTGAVYFAETQNHRIRKITTDGTISTVAGTGVAGFSGDGADATQAQLNFPYGIMIDIAGAVYIADMSNHRIRKIATDGIISTVAGTGVAGFSGDGAEATQAQLYSPHGITVDSAGAVYIADSYNYRIRKIDSQKPVYPLDFDGDFVADGIDNCVNDNNLAQKDTDADNQGDACDLDDDNDTISDVDEIAAGTNPLKADTDGDGLDDAKEILIGTNPLLDADFDGDGLSDANEILLYNTLPKDADTDKDSLIDGLDNCPSVANADQSNSDNDDLGNACDATPNGPLIDSDGDGLIDGLDNCPDIANASQKDSDHDGLGDACSQSLDIDGSGEINTFDLLMVQRYMGGVTNLSANIKLPENVGGSGLNGQMTNEELRNNTTQMLSSLSLDVDGDGESNVFDLLMMQRYLGGVSNISSNIKLPESVNGSGENGKRSIEEIRQSIEASLTASKPELPSINVLDIDFRVNTSLLTETSATGDSSWDGVDVDFTFVTPSGDEMVMSDSANHWNCKHIETNHTNETIHSVRCGDISSKEAFQPGEYKFYASTSSPIDTATESYTLTYDYVVELSVSEWREGAGYTKIGTTITLSGNYAGAGSGAAEELSYQIGVNPSPVSLDGLWRSNSGDVIDCEDNTCELLVPNSESDFVINKPSTAGMSIFSNIEALGNNLFSASTFWVQYTSDSLEFEQFFYTHSDIELLTENTFVSISQSPNFNSRTKSTYNRIKLNGEFAAEKVWTENNKQEPISFTVNESGDYYIDYSGKGSVYLTDITNNVVHAKLENVQKYSLYLEAGNYILIPDVNDFLPTFNSKTTLIPHLNSSPDSSISSNNFGAAEFYSGCEFGYIFYCPIGVNCASRSICYIPTLEGNWIKNDGRTYRCTESSCVLTKYGTGIAGLKNLPNTLGSKMLFNIIEIEENRYKATKRSFLFDHDTKVFDEYKFENTEITFDPPNSFSYSDTTYSRISAD
jgi:hypothetical protein